MSHSVITKLTEAFRRFPGIGPRQAGRFVYYLLRAPNGTTDNLLRLISELKKETSQCQKCFRFFAPRAPICDLCSDTSRDDSLLMVIEKDSDLETVRRAGVYNGRFFVLGGLVDILGKNPEQHIRLREVQSRLQTDKQIKEVILALAANPEGDHTTEYLMSKFKGQNSKLIFSTLGRGLSTGTELEYSDADTLKNALRHRESA